MSNSNQNTGEVQLELRTIIEEDLPMQIDCVQWHPGNRDFIAVGAYQLCPNNSDIRLGRIYILQLTPSVPGGFQVVLEHETKGGVLDMKFHHNVDFDYLAVGTSAGVFVFQLSLDPQPTLILLDNLETKMCLYLEWIDGETLIFSDAEGSINMIESNDSNKYQLTKSKKMHETLTWVVHYDSDQEMVYCGSDDGKFTAFELKQMLREEFHLNIKYDVGVTSVSTQQEIVAIGGYDDMLKIYELTQRNPKPFLQILTRIKLGGAVWRSMFVPNLTGEDAKWVMVTACARDGIKVLEYDRHSCTIKVIYDFMKYKGFLAYGLDVKIDWVGMKYLLATGYYDNHVLHVFGLEYL